MLFLIGKGQERPSVTQKNKDKKYHADFAKYCLGSANNHQHHEFLEKAALNKNFYKGNQWVMQEDLEAFFKDDTLQERNRIKIIKNMVRPMVEQYRGNAVRMQINARAKSVSPMAINRREEKLAEMLFYTKIANQEGNPFSESLKKKLPIGENEGETQQIFENIYVDKYTQKINYLMRYVAEKNKFSSKQFSIAEHLALTGIGVIKTYEYSGHQVFEVIDPANYFFDRSCKEYDHSDADYWGDISMMTLTEVLEKYPDLETEEVKALEQFAKSYNQNILEISSKAKESGATSVQFDGRIPVYNVYWRDCDVYDVGYVKDEFGYPYLTKINHSENGEDPKYTDNDLIEVNTEKAKRLLKGKKKRKMFLDTIRMASIIPVDILNSSKLDDGTGKKEDIVLDFGPVPYQETESIDYASVKSPYKVFCWGYIDGEIMSPVDDAINPQRFINRILSIAENQINNSRGSGLIYDKSALDPAEGEAGLLRDMNQSKPVGFNAKGRGIQNIATTYDTSVKQGTLVLFNIVDTMKSHIQDVTGVNEALKGESTGSDQLVGVTQLLIQRGSLMQEPFYNAITEIFLQCYQSIATVGKKIYADNERNLAIAVGDDALEMIKITKDMKLEDFRCFVKRENMEEVLINAGNQMLMTFLQLGMVDKLQFSNLYGRSTPDDIATAIRIKAKSDLEIARMQQKQDEKAQAELAMQAQAEEDGAMAQMAEMQAREDIRDLDNKKHEMNSIMMKNLGKLVDKNPEVANMMMQETKKNLQNPVV